MKSFVVKGKVWKYAGPAGWYFVYVGDKESATLKKNVQAAKKIGWGFIPVKATLGKSTWKTTLFPSKEGSYLLALKADIRRREGIEEGELVKIAVSVI